MPRQAMLLVADEIYYNLHGKAILHGIYNGDLVIPVDPSPVPQLIFYFVVEADLTDPFTSLAVEVTLPESTPIRQPVVIFPWAPQLTPPGRSRLFYRQPILVQHPQLRPGRIEAKVIHEGGEMIVGGPWISLPPAPPIPTQN